MIDLVAFDITLKKNAGIWENKPFLKEWSLIIAFIILNSLIGSLSSLHTTK
jgi:hypothetical protein